MRAVVSSVLITLLEPHQCFLGPNCWEQVWDILAVVRGLMPWLARGKRASFGFES